MLFDYLRLSPFLPFEIKSMMNTNYVSLYSNNYNTPKKRHTLKVKIKELIKITMIIFKLYNKII